METRVDGFIFYASYYDGISELTEEEQGRLYTALMRYVFEGIEPELSGGPGMAFKFMKPTIDANIQRRINGRLGGRPKAEEKPNQKPNANQDHNQTLTKPITKSKPKDKDKNKINNNISERDNKTAAAGVSAQDVIDLYNAICISLPKAEKVTKIRSDHIKARLKENAPEEIRTAFEKAEASDFLTGRIEGKTWRADFDWITGSPTHFQRILEGVYDNRRTASALDAADRVAEALIGSASPEAVAEFEKSMNGGYTI